ncbi:hypothetical protein H0H93_012563 [Arthromyces matolae]|nr:hypothetical protein H0H93_012563 [Arthromyces matolae]
MRSTPIPHISELSYDVNVVDSLASRPLEVATERVDSSMVAETDVGSGHAFNPVAHSESLRKKIFARAEWDPLKETNGRKMKKYSIPIRLAGWKGIPPDIYLPDKRIVTKDDVNDLTNNFIIPIQDRISKAEMGIDPPEDLKDKRQAFNHWQSVLRTRYGFRTLTYENGGAPKGSSTSIPSNDPSISRSQSPSRPNSAHQQTEGQEPTAPETGHRFFDDFQHLPIPIPSSFGHPESTAPGTATQLHPLFGDFRHLPIPSSPSAPPLP